jgi:hypothetical protein
MATRNDPVQRLLDLAVYAPIGALTLLQRELPKLADDGRNRVGTQVTVARMIGQFAVAQGRKELDKRLAAFTAAATTGPSTAARRPVDTSATERPSPSGSEHLAIVGYDELAASQVVACLTGLSPDELTAIADYERSHRNRRTVLAKVAQLLGA